MNFIKRLKLRPEKEAEAEDSGRRAECLARIKAAVAQRAGTARVIEAEDGAVAFAGSRENRKLLLELSTVKGGDGKRFLYASVDDEVSWQEDDFESAAEFEAAISDYIARRVGRTVKTVTTAEKGKLTVKTYYRNDAGEWVPLSDETVRGRVVSFLARRLKMPGESTETYTPVSAESGEKGADFS